MRTRVVSFHYKLTNGVGKVLDSTEGNDPLSYLEGVGQIIPALETILKTLKIGEKKKVEIKAKEAYGKLDPKKVIEVPIEQMPKQDIKIGDKFRSSRDPNAPLVTVTKITKTHVTVDANHPLAGEDLTFDVEVTGHREATEDELSHGHVHGPGGHHHH